MADLDYRLPYVPKGAWLEERLVRCGKICRCQLGQPHGTYWRLCWRKRGQKRQRYIPAQHIDLYQAAVQARREQVRERRRGFVVARAGLASARHLLRRLRVR